MSPGPRRPASIVEQHRATLGGKPVLAVGGADETVAYVYVKDDVVFAYQSQGNAEVDGIVFAAFP